MKRKIVIVLILVFFFSAISPFAIVHINKLLVGKSEAVITADKTENITIKKGDLVYFGEYLGEPILWKAASNYKDGKILLVSEKVVCFKAFDASGKDEKYHPSKDFEKYGNADWNDSTLKQWLNSSDKKVVYSHCTPSSENVYGGANAYDKESGFLCEENFTEAQRNLITSDGVFLPSKSYLQKNYKAEKRRKIATSSAIAHNDSAYINFPEKAVWYWTSDKIDTNNVSVATVTSSGGFYKSLAYDSNVGVCPAIYLKTDKISAKKVDGENKYLIIGGVIDD